MKQLTDDDIKQMLTDDITTIDEKNVRRSVRTELRMSERIPRTTPTPSHSVLDLHNLTQEQAWNAIMTLAQSGTRTATLITGASGILKIKFQQWATNSILTPYLISFSPINNGSFFVKFKKQPKNS